MTLVRRAGARPACRLRHRARRRAGPRPIVRTTGHGGAGGVNTDSSGTACTSCRRCGRDVRRASRGLRCWPLLEGFRGRPPWMSAPWSTVVALVRATGPGRARGRGAGPQPADGVRLRVDGGRSRPGWPTRPRRPRTGTEAAASYDLTSAGRHTNGWPNEGTISYNVPRSAERGANRTTRGDRHAGSCARSGPRPCSALTERSVSGIPDGTFRQHGRPHRDSPMQTDPLEQLERGSECIGLSGSAIERGRADVREVAGPRLRPGPNSTQNRTTDASPTTAETDRATR